MIVTHIHLLNTGKGMLMAASRKMYPAWESIPALAQLNLYRLAELRDLEPIDSIFENVAAITSFPSKLVLAERLLVTQPTSQRGRLWLLDKE